MPSAAGTVPVCNITTADNSTAIAEAFNFQSTLMSALGMTVVLRDRCHVAQQLRQLGDVGGDASRLVPRQQAGGYTPGISCWANA